MKLDKEKKSLNTKAPSISSLDTDTKSAKTCKVIYNI